MHQGDLVRDLAVMLITAGVITIVFRKLRQPLILGYLVAGFITGPYFPAFMDVEDMGSIEIWSEIGVIILMFHIGMEFNVHKLARMGVTPIVSAIVKMGGMLAVGYILGTAMGYSTISSIFLGGMLSISSTAVIQKSFDELNVKKEKYAGFVMGSLIIEDIAGVFMLVVLSTISVSQNVQTGELAAQLMLMVCYLIAWLILGIFLMPSFLNRAVKFMNEEMMNVISLGFCFGMVMIARALGFSSELGAFLAGSILAGTVHVEKIEKITRGFKDVFVAIFFLSVGMMVNPSVIAGYWWEIILIAGVAVVAKIIIASIAMILAGQNLEIAVKGGFSLAPIGEFSFIIASLGISLGVMDEKLYPMIVAAAVITTFFTPFLIKRSDMACSTLEKVLPKKVRNFINRYTDNVSTQQDNDWQEYLRGYFGRTVLYGGIMVVIAVAGVKILVPLTIEFMPETAGKILSVFLIYLASSLFVKPFLDYRNSYFTTLWLKSRANRIPLIVFSIIKVIIVSSVAMYTLNSLLDFRSWTTAVAVVAVVLITAKVGLLSGCYLRLETKFLRNLNERIIRAEEEKGIKQSWLDEELRIISLIVPEGADFIGKKMSELHWGRTYSILLVKIRRKGRQYILPGRKASLMAGDKIYVVGEIKSIENFYRLTGTKPTRSIRTLKEFMDTGYSDTDNALAICAVKVSGDEEFTGKKMKNSRIKEKYHCMILGMQKDGFPIVLPDPDTVISPGDLLWIMGSNNNVGRVVSESTVVEIGE